VNAAFIGVGAEVLQHTLEDRGIYVSAGSACAKGHRSHTLTAMNLPPEVMDGTFRVPLSGETTQQELDQLVETIRRDILEKYKPESTL
jgi:cysteine desulfurase